MIKRLNSHDDNQDEENQTEERVLGQADDPLRLGQQEVSLRK